jgi:hypothetical protein
MVEYNSALEVIKTFLEGKGYYSRIATPDVKKVESYPLPSAFIQPIGSIRNKLYPQVGREKIIISLIYQKVIDKHNEENIKYLNDKVDELLSSFGFSDEMQNLPIYNLAKETTDFRNFGFGRLFMINIIFEMLTYRG